VVGAETFHFDLDYLLDLDVLSFDRLLQKARDARNQRLMEEADILRIAVNSGFSGEDKPFKALLEAYQPADLRAAEEEERIQQSARKLANLFAT